MGELFDISLPLSAELPVWPGNPPFRLKAVHRLSDGARCNESEILTNIHTGTHIDAPWHFLAEGDTTDSIPLEKLVGPATVVALPNIRKVTGADLEGAGIGSGVQRVLLKTRNSNLWRDGVTDFTEDFVALTVDAAEWLAMRQIKLIGIDYLSIQLYGGSNRTHEALLEAGVIILEGLDLHQVEPGEYELICLPLAIRAAEGAPARAVLRKFGQTD